jgi:ADP-ribose pyrophosphatase
LRRATTPSEPIRILAHESVFHGRLLDVYVDRIESPDGTQRTREIVAHPGAVAIVPILPSGEILVVSQYRHAARSNLWEIPAGKIETGEDVLACARRELREETGCCSDRWTLLTSFFTSPGFSNERITLFRASDVRQVEPPDAAEITEQVALSIGEIERMIRTSEIIDAKTILAIGRLLCRSRRMK